MFWGKAHSWACGLSKAGSFQISRNNSEEIVSVFRQDADVIPYVVLFNCFLTFLICVLYIFYLFQWHETSLCSCNDIMKSFASESSFRTYICLNLFFEPARIDHTLNNLFPVLDNVYYLDFIWIGRAKQIGNVMNNLKLRKERGISKVALQLWYNVLQLFQGHHDRYGVYPKLHCNLGTAQVQVSVR